MNKIHYIIVSLIVGMLLIFSSLFVVNQMQHAVVFQFGEAVRLIEKPGLNIKIPFIQNVLLIDKRILNVSTEAQELTALDGKRIIVDAFAKFKIVDMVKFFKTVNNYYGAEMRLNKILESSMRKVIGKVSLSTLLTKERVNLMLSIRDLLHKEAQDFGVDVIDVRITKSDLHDENSKAIYLRMQTDREKEAKQIRAEGKEEAIRIKSTADKEKKIIIANAYAKAEKIKGDGDGEAARIYNLAYAKDAEFYKFYRSLVTYKLSLDGANTSFVLSPQSDFFKYLKLGH